MPHGVMQTSVIFSSAIVTTPAVQQHLKPIETCQ